MKHALIIEDDPAIRYFLKTLLEMEKFRVCETSDGLKGLNKLLNNQYQLVVLDLRLPIISGRDLIEIAYNKNLDLKNFVVASGNVTAELRDILKTYGVQHFLRKPFDIEVFKKVTADIDSLSAPSLPPLAQQGEQNNILATHRRYMYW